MPIGSFYIFANYIISQLIKSLLCFGIRNDLPVVRICHLANLCIRVGGIGFNFMDIQSVEYIWLKIIFGIIFLIN